MTLVLPAYSSTASGSVRQRFLDAWLSAGNSHANGARATTVVPAQTVNAIADAVALDLTVIPSNAVIPISYGRNKVVGQPFVVHVSGSTMYVAYLICKGEISTYNAIYIDDVDVTAADGFLSFANASVVSYTGTTAQTADPTLSGAIPGFADSYVSTAYVVIEVPVNSTSGFPRLSVDISGKKIYDSRLDSTNGGSGSHRIATPSTWSYTDNSALILADIITNHAKWSIDWPQAVIAADWCDELISGEKRKTTGYTVSSPIKLASAIEFARAHAGCFIGWANGDAHIFPDTVESVSKSFTADDIVNLTLKKKSPRKMPTVVMVDYVDRETEPPTFKRRTVTQKAAGVDAGTTPRRLSKVALLGIGTYDQANREAIQRLNSNLSDLSGTLELFDEGLELQIGSVIEVTHPIGLTSKQFRLLSVATKRANWVCEIEEYDPARYSEAIETTPTYSDTDLPPHIPPGAVTSLLAEEEVYQLQTGLYASRLRVSWDESVSPYLLRYQIRLIIAGNIVWTASDSARNVATGPVKEGVQHTVEVRAITSLFEGASSTVLISPAGKFLIPGDVASLSGFEVGGEVRLNWPAAIDLDVERYEIRYGAVAVAWNDAIVIDRVDTLRLQTKDVPPGTWDFLVKAIDSVKQYSANAATVSFAVTLDDDAFLVDSATYVDSATGDLLTHRRVEVREADDIIYTNTSSETWNTLFGAAVMSTKTSELASYQATPGTDFQYYPDKYDLGQDYTGTWRQNSSDYWKQYGGTLVRYFDLQLASLAWTNHTTESVQDTARYARFRLAGKGLARIDTNKINFRVDAVARYETGSDTSNSGSAKTITLANEYSTVKSINITAQGTAARTATYDNIVLGATTTFDVYIFDSAGTQVANDFIWDFRGV